MVTVPPDAARWAEWARRRLASLRDSGWPIAISETGVSAMLELPEGAVRLQHHEAAAFTVQVPGGAVGLLFAGWRLDADPRSAGRTWHLAPTDNVMGASQHHDLGAALHELRRLMAWGRQIERADPRPATPPEAPADGRQPPDA